MSIFEEQMDRIKLITGKTTQAEIAAFFGIRQGAVASAKRRKKIPSAWLVQLVQKKMIHPDWILTGKGSRFLKSVDKVQHPAISEENQPDALGTVSPESISEELLDELVRRAVERLGGERQKA